MDVSKKRTWNPEACFLTFQKGLEVVCVSFTTAITEFFTLLGDCIVVITLDVVIAHSLFNLQQANFCGGINYAFKNMINLKLTCNSPVSVSGFIKTKHRSRPFYYNF